MIPVALVTQTGAGLVTPAGDSAAVVAGDG
jgi:hypothetical protein